MAESVQAVEGAVNPYALAQAAHAAAEQDRGDEERGHDRDGPDDPGVPGDVDVGGRLEPGRIRRRDLLLGFVHDAMVPGFRGGLKVNVYFCGGGCFGGSFGAGFDGAGGGSLVDDGSDRKPSGAGVPSATALAGGSTGAGSSTAAVGAAGATGTIGMTVVRTGPGLPDRSIGTAAATETRNRIAAAAISPWRGARFGAGASASGARRVIFMIRLVRHETAAGSTGPAVSSSKNSVSWLTFVSSASWSMSSARSRRASASDSTTRLSISSSSGWM